MMKLRSIAAITILSIGLFLQSRAVRSEPSKILESIQISHEVLPQDPAVVMNSRVTNGFLTYNFLVPYGSGIAVRHFHNGKQSITSYTLKFVDWQEYGVFDCKRSPDGRYIAFKYGADFSSYKLCILDTQAKTLRIASEENLSFRDFFFSPDSKYIAFVAGGNYWGQTNTKGAMPLRLLCYNVVKDKAEVVPITRFFPTSLAWLAPHTLYFSAQKDTSEKTVSLKKPDLYQFDPMSSKVTWAMKDCYRPSFSPDGNKVAFFGSENPDKPFPLLDGWQYNAKYMALCVSNLDGSERIALTVEKGNYPRIVWSHSPTALYELQQTQPSPQAKLAIIKWDIHSRKKADVVDVFSKDYKPILTDETGSSPTFSLVGSGGSNNKILVAVVEVKGRDPKRPVLNILQTLQSIDLMNKTIVPVVSSHKSLSYDWESD